MSDTTQAVPPAVAQAGGAAMNLKALRDLRATEACNILDIQVPPELDDTIATGIPYLDDAFGGGGITPSTSAILTGDPGAGKTTLELQVAEALSKVGHQVIVNSREESVEQIRRTARRLRFTKGFIVSAERRVPDLLASLRELRRREQDRCDSAHERMLAAYMAMSPDDRAPAPPPKPRPPRQFLLLDSIQAHDCGKYTNGGTNSMTPIRIAEQVTDWCKETFNVAIMIGHVTKSGKIAGKQQLVHTVDVHAHVRIEQDSESQYFGDRVFTVNKNRFGCAGITYVLQMSASGFSEKGRLMTGDVADVVGGEDES